MNFIEVTDKNRDTVFNRLREIPVVAYDLETTGLFWWKDQVVCAAVGTDEKVFWFQDVAGLSEVLEGKTIIGHNLKFDLHFGPIKNATLFDTLIAHYLLYPEAKKRGLKELASQYFQAEDYAVDVKHINNLDKEQLKIYNCKDVVFTYKLYNLFKDRVKDNYMFNFLNKFIFTLIEIEKNGVVIDKDIFNKVKTELVTDLELVNVKLKSFSDINFNSTKQLRDLLYNKMRLPILEETEKGAPSTSEETLVQLQKTDTTGLIEALLSHRKLAKLVSTYIEGLEPLIKNSRCYPSYNVCRTLTGRLACNDPNFQNQPKHEGILSFFTSRFPGGVLVQVDYCVAPETLVLCSDLSWAKAGDLTIGKKIIGFDEAPKNSKFREATILNKKIILRPCYRITTNRGEVISSEEHRWLYCGNQAQKCGRSRGWKTTKDLKVGEKLPFFASPWEEDFSKEGAYLKGIFDGEGSVSGTVVGFGQNEGIVLNKVRELLTLKGYAYGLTSKQGNVWKLCLKGGQVSQRFLGSIRPHRLIGKGRKTWENRRTWGKNTAPAVIERVEFLGEKEVVSLETSSKTFIANGFFAHNCQVELRVLAHCAGAMRMKNYFAQEKLDLHRKTASDIFSVDPSAVTDEMRQMAKTVNFGIVYGQTKYSLAKQLEIPVAKANHLINKWFYLFPEIRDLHMRLKDMAANGEKVSTEFGRFHHAAALEYNQLINFPIQSTASDINIHTLVELSTALTKENFKAKIIGTVHDSVVCDCPNEEFVSLILLVKKIFKGVRLPFNFTVPLEIDVKYGSNLNGGEKI